MRGKQRAIDLDKASLSLLLLLFALKTVQVNALIETTNLAAGGNGVDFVNGRYEELTFFGMDAADPQDSSSSSSSSSSDSSFISFSGDESFSSTSTDSRFRADCTSSSSSSDDDDDEERRRAIASSSGDDDDDSTSTVDLTESVGRRCSAAHYAQRCVVESCNNNQGDLFVRRLAEEGGGEVGNSCEFFDNAPNDNDDCDDAEFSVVASLTTHKVSRLPRAVSRNTAALDADDDEVVSDIVFDLDGNSLVVLESAVENAAENDVTAEILNVPQVTLAEFKPSFPNLGERFGLIGKPQFSRTAFARLTLSTDIDTFAFADTDGLDDNSKLVITLDYDSLADAIANRNGRDMQIELRLVADAGNDLNDREEVVAGARRAVEFMRRLKKCALAK